MINLVHLWMLSCLYAEFQHTGMAKTHLVQGILKDNYSTHLNVQLPCKWSTPCVINLATVLFRHGLHCMRIRACYITVSASLHLVNRHIMKARWKSCAAWSDCPIITYIIYEACKAIGQKSHSLISHSIHWNREGYFIALSAGPDWLGEEWPVLSSLKLSTCYCYGMLWADKVK